MGLLVTATAVSVGLEVWLGHNVDRVYYGTDTRAAELLLGAVLAVWWSGRRDTAGRFARSDVALRTRPVVDAAEDVRQRCRARD